VALTVSKLAARVGLTADTIRYYERAGLLPPPDRTASGYRAFDDDAVRDSGSRALNASAFVSRRSRNFSTSGIAVFVRAVTLRTF